jgi:putative oxidoreductase
MSQMGVAGVLELVGGILLTMGLFTRPVAVILLAEMIAAYFIAHLPQGPWPILNQGELALLYASAFLFLAGNGAGAFSLDSLLPVYPERDRRHVPGDRRSRVAA